MFPFGFLLLLLRPFVADMGFTKMDIGRGSRPGLFVNPLACDLALISLTTTSMFSSVTPMFSSVD